MRAAYYEAPRGVDQNACVARKQSLGDNGLYNLAINGVLQHGLRCICAVLRGNEHSVHAHGRAVFVNNAHLRLAVRLYEVRAALAVRRQPAGKRMGQIYWQGHILFRFIGGIAEHHALIPRAGGHVRLRTFLRLKRFIHAHGNIARLLIQRYQHRAAVARKAGGIIRIAYFVHGGAHKGRYVHLRLGRYFAHHQHKAGRCRAFARHAGVRVNGKVRIQHAVA